MASASSTFTILGRPAALEGDTIECRACKSAGVIACAGPRHLDTFNGRALALEGDLCMCRCQEHPQLVAGQQSSFHTLDGIGTDLSPAPAHEARHDGADALATSDRVHTISPCRGSGSGSTRLRVAKGFHVGSCLTMARRPGPPAWLATGCVCTESGRTARCESSIASIRPTALRP